MSAKHSLLAAQQAFMAQVLDEEEPVPASWNERQAAGMDVYRGNYRSAVVEAVIGTYEQTRRWVGEEPFKRAAIHHVITRPPSGWTIDDVGAQFDASCTQVFGNDPEVAELAWLEWAMLEASRAADASALTPEGFGQATAQFGDEDWGTMRLEFIPGASARTLDHNLHAIWQALGAEPFERPDFVLDTPRGCIVWREDDRPTFLMVDADNVRALNAAKNGSSYGEICMVLAGEDPSEQAMHDAAMGAGAMLGQWLNEGIIRTITTA